MHTYPVNLLGLLRSRDKRITRVLTKKSYSVILIHIKSRDCSCEENSAHLQYGHYFEMGLRPGAKEAARILAR